MLRRLGGHSALDLVNTVDPREGDGRVEYLRSFEDLLHWAQGAGVLKASEVRQAAQEAARDGRAAARALDRAIALREAIYAVFAAVVTRRPAPADAIDELEAAYRQAMAHARLARKASAFRWQLHGGLDIVRWHIARDAVALLESDRLGRIKRCPGGSGDCGWLFLDRSKNASRRWCSMEGCGNRAKVRRFHRQQTRAPRHSR
ncbi:MAG TPA: ABATE domain-containing protein [Vicinamibacterales bacterium]|jgi:predicted RNA-binding Zn ribbon-like protein|nr:ABATE domain-containing protein [Vicinamibacterales bacterium]